MEFTLAIEAMDCLDLVGREVVGVIQSWSPTWLRDA